MAPLAKMHKRQDYQWWTPSPGDGAYDDWLSDQTQTQPQAAQETAQPQPQTTQDDQTDPQQTQTQPDAASAAVESKEAQPVDQSPSAEASVEESSDEVANTSEQLLPVASTSSSTSSTSHAMATDQGRLPAISSSPSTSSSGNDFFATISSSPTNIALTSLVCVAIAAILILPAAFFLRRHILRRRRRAQLASTYTEDFYHPDLLDCKPDCEEKEASPVSSQVERLDAVGQVPSLSFHAPPAFEAYTESSQPHRVKAKALPVPPPAAATAHSQPAALMRASSQASSVWSASTARTGTVADADADADQRIRDLLRDRYTPL